MKNEEEGKKEKHGMMVRLENNQVLFFIITAVLLAIMLIPGVLLDFTYMNIIKCTFVSRVIDFLRKCLCPFGFGYEAAQEFLKSYIGVLITVLSLVLSITLGISERLEKRVFGIVRSEFELNPHSVTYKFFRNISWLAPVFIIICLNLNLCACGYFLVIYSYTALLYLYIKRNGGFDQKKSREGIIRLLLRCFSSPDDSAELKILNYEGYLECIGADAEREYDWKIREQLYRELLLEIGDFSSKGKFELSYRFFKGVFGRNEKIRDDVSFRIIQSYLLSVWSKKHEELPENYFSKNRLNEDEIIFVSMLYACVIRAKEYSITQFLDWYLRIDELSGKQCEQTGREILWEMYCRHTVLLLIFIEEWLYLHENANELLQDAIKRLWGYGESYFYFNVDPYDPTGHDFTEELSELCSNRWVDEQKHMVIEAKQRLVSYCHECGRSMIHLMSNLL